MTTAYRPTWDTPTAPELGEELVYGDLCDITLCHPDGARVPCHQTAVFAATDVTSRLRILCAEHTALYFPTV